MAYTATSFLAKIKSDVIADAARSGILASLTAAQALIESGSGNSGLSQKAYNLFGIKGRYNGQYIVMRTQEWSAAKGYYWINAEFRRYSSFAESIRDHSDFLLKNSRYKNIIGVKDYRTACRLIQQDGYATSPTYASTLIKTIETYKLHTWDGAGPRFDTSPLQIAREGDTSIWTMILQDRLKVIGAGIDADGIFGPATKAAVIDFQKRSGLDPDAVVGPLTWAALFR